jgi:8-oxo-dGTP pyrophosphatase MutT (NUDIX family)
MPPGRDRSLPLVEPSDRLQRLLPIPLQRLGYRTAHGMLRLVWFVTRPHRLGVKCLITDGDRVLLVRHVYGIRWWDLPGGSPARGESMGTAIRRELREELGLEPDEVEPIGVVDSLLYHRRDDLYLFRAEVNSPALTVAPAELAEVRWFDRASLPPALSPYVIPALARTAVRRRRQA